MLPRLVVDTRNARRVPFFAPTHVLFPRCRLQERTLVSPGSTTTASPVRAAASHTPLFFESAGRPLFGVLHSAVPGRTNPPVVVHVHGVGVEQITLYRAEVQGARAAAAAGFPVFRWHARGHGDSAGNFAAVTLEALVED